MNADLEKIRRSKFFAGVSQDAFDHILKHLKVRSFQNCEEVLKFGPSNSHELANYLGYVVVGRVLFLSEASKPLGIAVKDEFFLGRPFTLSETPVDRLMAAADSTLVIFIPKEIVSLLTKASRRMADMLEEIYESIFERAKLITQDSSAPKAVQDWIVNPDGQKTLSNWVGVIEKKRAQSHEKRAKDARLSRIIFQIWLVALAFCFFVTVESLNRHWQTGVSYVTQWLPYFTWDKLEPGSRWNILLGIMGYIFLALTLAHTLVKWGIRKRKWKLNFQISQNMHFLFGVVGSYLVLLHVAFHMTGMNIAYWALYSVLITLFTGFVGQFISAQIPKTISGEKRRLDSLKGEQQKLQQKAELLMTNDQMYKTSVLLISKGVSTSFWGNLLSTPLLWFRARKVKGALTNLGLGAQGAAVAADLIRKEFQLRQKIRFMEISNLALKRWMVIHKPLGFAVYITGAIHIILVILSL